MARLKSGIWVRATLRRLAAQGLMAVVARKGDEDAGDVMVKHRQGDGRYHVLSQARRGEELVWINRTGTEPVSEAEADRMIARAVDVDGDLWVIEIEGGTEGAILLEVVLP